MKNDCGYIAKQIINFSDEHKTIAITCVNKRNLKGKNKSFENIADILSSNDNFTLVNYDKTYKGKTDIDATDKCSDLSYDFDKIDVPDKKIALVNINPIIGCETLLDKDSALNKVILYTEYGKTSQSDMIKCSNILKENHIEVLAVIANKNSQI